MSLASAGSPSRAAEDPDHAVDLDPLPARAEPWFHDLVAASASSRSEPVPAGASPPTPVPRTLGRYRILDELASGGMATLYLAATDGPAGYEKMVALKRIHPHLAREKRFLDMFLDEARLAARIVHPNVCGVFDFGEANGQHFLAMEFLAGVPLSDLLRAVGRSAELRADPMWVPVVGRILRDAAEGLHAAHELRDADGRPLGVVHRDVSPQNIFIGFDGTTRVIDFGVAAAADRIHHTATGEVKGKFAYMAPEQVNHDEPDRRLDVWALGVVAWEALTLRRLFRREGTAATLYAVLEEPVETPSEVSPRLPSAIDRPILRALVRDRAERTPTARELGDALRVAIESTGARLAEPGEIADFLRRAMPDREDSLRSRIVTARARRRADADVSAGERLSSRSLLVAVVCLALIGLAAGAWGLRSLADTERAEPTLAREPAVTSAPRIEHASATPPPTTAAEVEPEATLEVTTPAASPPPSSPHRRRGPGRTRGETRGESGGPDLATEW